MNYDDSSLAWNWVTYKAERDYITFTNTTDPAAELLAAGKLLTESQAQVTALTAYTSFIPVCGADYDGEGNRVAIVTLFTFTKGPGPHAHTA